MHVSNIGFRCRLLLFVVLISARFSDRTLNSWYWFYYALRADSSTLEQTVLYHQHHSDTNINTLRCSVITGIPLSLSLTLEDSVQSPLQTQTSITHVNNITSHITTFIIIMLFSCCCRGESKKRKKGVEVECPGSPSYQPSLVFTPHSPIFSIQHRDTVPSSSLSSEEFYYYQVTALIHTCRYKSSEFLLL